MPPPPNPAAVAVIGLKVNAWVATPSPRPRPRSSRQGVTVNGSRSDHAASQWSGKASARSIIVPILERSTSIVDRPADCDL
jgi:hypothetical protein